jgi:hypothetical protein
MATGFYWVVPPTNQIERIYKMRRATIRAARARFNEFSNEVEYHMKTNHPWQNRTSTAEDSLEAVVGGADGSSHTEAEMTMDIGYNLGILLSHPDGRRRDYSVYLEGYLGLGIIQPTMDAMASRAMRRFYGIMTL